MLPSKLSESLLYETVYLSGVTATGQRRSKAAVAVAVAVAVG